MDSGDDGSAGGKGLENGAKAQILYDEIVRGANYFLHNCSKFPMEVLARQNPTYEEIADVLDSLVKVVVALSSDFDPMMGQKALEYCLLMKKMGVAIAQQDQVELTRLVEEMRRRPGT